MKKKIGDLTIKEIKKLCENSNCNCVKCPLPECFMYFKTIKIKIGFEELEKEIEVEEMSKDEIIKEIKNEIEDYIFQSNIDSYIKGYLDALCKTYEITWDERGEIEEELKNE